MPIALHYTPYFFRMQIAKIENQSRKKRINVPTKTGNFLSKISKKQVFITFTLKNITQKILLKHLNNNFTVKNRHVIIYVIKRE